MNFEKKKERRRKKKKIGAPHAIAAWGLRGQAAKEKKSLYKIKDKQTPHTVLQKLSPKAWPAPLRIRIVTLESCLPFSPETCNKASRMA